MGRRGRSVASPGEPVCVFEFSCLRVSRYGSTVVSGFGWEKRTSRTSGSSPGCGSSGSHRGGRARRRRGDSSRCSSPTPCSGAAPQARRGSPRRWDAGGGHALRRRETSPRRKPDPAGLRTRPGRASGACSAGAALRALRTALTKAVRIGNPSRLTVQLQSFFGRIGIRPELQVHLGQLGLEVFGMRVGCQQVAPVSMEEGRGELVAVVLTRRWQPHNWRHRAAPRPDPIDIPRRLLGMIWVPAGDTTAASLIPLQLPALQPGGLLKNAPLKW